jgi:hypothetical protein
MERYKTRQPVLHKNHQLGHCRKEPQVHYKKERQGHYKKVQQGRYKLVQMVSHKNQKQEHCMLELMESCM